MAQGLEDSNLVPESSFLIGISVHQSLHSNKQPMPASLVHLDIKRTSAVCVSAKKTIFLLLWQACALQFVTSITISRKTGSQTDIPCSFR
jgi:hypothetical protein